MGAGVPRGVVIFQGFNKKQVDRYRNFGKGGDVTGFNPIPGGLRRDKKLAGGADSAPPFRSQKLHIAATNGERRLIGRLKIYNFYIKHFQVRSILRSPEVINDKMFWN